MYSYAEALESYIITDIATEAIMDNIKAKLSKIGDFIKTIINKLRSWINTTSMKIAAKKEEKNNINDGPLKAELNRMCVNLSKRNNLCIKFVNLCHSMNPNNPNDKKNEISNLGQQAADISNQFADSEEKVRDYIDKGLRVSPDDIKRYTQFFNTEITKLEQLEKRARSLNNIPPETMQYIGSLINGLNENIKFMNAVNKSSQLRLTA